MTSQDVKKQVSEDPEMLVVNDLQHFFKEAFGLFLYIIY